MHKTIKQRITVLILLALCFFAVYGAARYYSPMIVAFVVKQALIQKAPEGMSPILVRERFEAFWTSTPPGEKMKKLMDLSNYLEKVQKLTPGELDRLLAVDGSPAGTGL